MVILLCKQLALVIIRLGTFRYPQWNSPHGHRHRIVVVDRSAIVAGRLHLGGTRLATVEPRSGAHDPVRTALLYDASIGVKVVTSGTDYILEPQLPTALDRGAIAAMLWRYLQTLYPPITIWKGQLTGKNSVTKMHQLYGPRRQLHCPRCA